MSNDTNENKERIRIEPQPEIQLAGAWAYDGKIYPDKYAMSDYLYNAVYNEGLGNSTDFDECEPILIDGVWYWEAW
jgi:hypothetical protein